jgi:hypothetical protein
MGHLTETLGGEGVEVSLGVAFAAGIAVDLEVTETEIGEDTVIGEAMGGIGEGLKAAVVVSIPEGIVDPEVLEEEVGEWNPVGLAAAAFEAVGIFKWHYKGRVSSKAYE